MLFKKFILPVLAAAVCASCSLTGTDRAFLQNGPSSTTTYTVQHGDTLYSIARKYGLDPQAVARENAITNPSLLRVGQVLRLTVSSNPDDNVSRIRAAETAPAVATPVAAPVVASTVAAAQPVDEVEDPVKPAPAGTVVSLNGTAPYMWPVSGRITRGVEANHNGVDIAVPSGTPVKAVADGSVVYVGTQDHFGKTVMIRHDNGNYVSVYCHNSNVGVNIGEKITKGAVIGKSGTDDSGNAKLHFELRKMGKPVEPSTVIH